MSRTLTYVKAIGGGLALCVGGPAFVMWVSPTEEELVKRYNPELKARSIAGKQQKEEEFNDFVMSLKEASKSDKPIWQAQKEIQKRQAEEKAKRLRDEAHTLQDEVQKRQGEIRASAINAEKKVEQAMSSHPGVIAGVGGALCAVAFFAHRIYNS